MGEIVKMLSLTTEPVQTAIVSFGRICAIGSSQMAGVWARRTNTGR